MGTEKQKVVCPPDQVFKDQEFEYLLTIGGDLVDNVNEYDKFKKLLKSIGETEFYIRENLGATVTGRNEPFQTIINLTDDYESFQKKVKEFEPPFGWSINHFFVYGQSENWGIYIAEFPTINIIGCDKRLSDKFRQVFSITRNGYLALNEFITTEFQSNPDHLNEFIKQYNLEENE